MSGKCTDPPPHLHIGQLDDHLLDQRKGQNRCKTIYHYKNDAWPKNVETIYKGRWQARVWIFIQLSCITFVIMQLHAAVLSLFAITGATQSITPSPPSFEPIEVVELPLPPVAPSNRTSSCTRDVNPRGTGCILRELADSKFQSGDFTPDGNNIAVTVNFVGAPEEPDPASIYDGEQLILVKADGTNFSNGDPWKCLSCGFKKDSERPLDTQKDYPHVFRSGDKALWGHK